MYKRENRIATQKGLKHMCESSTQFGGDFALPPAPCTPPKLAFDVGMAATRFCAPPDVHLFEYAAGGCPIYIEHEALASSVELVELRQIIYHQLAHRLLGVKDPNARVGIGTKPLLKTNCMRNAVIDPEVTLTDGGNLECFITSFDKPVSQSDRKRAYAMWPRDTMAKPKKAESGWKSSLRKSFPVADPSRVPPPTFFNDFDAYEPLEDSDLTIALPNGSRCWATF
jgi:hypothetical protein